MTAATDPVVSLTLLTLIGALRSAARATLTAIRQRIGFIFQEHHLLDSLSARQNVQMSLGAAALAMRPVRLIDPADIV